MNGNDFTTRRNEAVAKRYRLCHQRSSTAYSQDQVTFYFVVDRPKARAEEQGGPVLCSPYCQVDNDH